MLWQCIANRLYADIYWSGGRLDLARASYEKALEIYLCYNIVERWLKELEQDESLSVGQKRRYRVPETIAAAFPCMHGSHVQHDK